MSKPVPVSILSQLLDMTPRNIQLLAAAGVIPKPVDRKYDLVACSVGYIRYLRKIGQGEGSASLVDERAALTAIKKEREKLKLEEDRKNLVPYDEAVKWVSLFVSEARQGFLNLPRRMGSVLALISDEKEIELQLRNEIYTILRALADGKKRGVSK
jgi:hypothetical protein